MLALKQAVLGPRAAWPNLGGLLALSPALLRSLSTVTTDDDADQPHDKRYVDRLKITARGGKGGNGCMSFYQGAGRGEGRALLEWCMQPRVAAAIRANVAAAAARRLPPAAWHTASPLPAIHLPHAMQAAMRWQTAAAVATAAMS